MRGATVIPALRHSTGLPGFDAARWTRLPRVRHVVTDGEDWGVLLQDPTPANDEDPPLEAVLPEQRQAAVLAVLAGSGAVAALRGPGQAPPLSVPLRHGRVVVLPPGSASRLRSMAGEEQMLHLHLSPDFLSDLARRAGVAATPLPRGALPRDGTRTWLVRHLVRELEDRQPGWRRAVASTVTLIAAQLLPPGKS